MGPQGDQIGGDIKFDVVREKQEVIGRRGLAGWGIGSFVIVADGWPSWLMVLSLLGSVPVRIYVKEALYKKLNCHLGSNWIPWSGAVDELDVTNVSHVFASGSRTLAAEMTRVSREVTLVMAMESDGLSKVPVEIPLNWFRI